MASISSVGGSCCASLIPPIGRMMRTVQKENKFKEHLKLSKAVELKLSPAAAIQQLMKAKLEGKVGRVVSMAEAFRDMLKQAQRAREGDGEFSVKNITAMMTVVEFLETELRKLDEERAEVLRERYGAPGDENSIITQCEKLKLRFKEDDMTTDEGVETIIKAAQSFDGNLGSFTDDLKTRVYTAYHETDPREKWGITPIEGGALQNSIEAREMAVNVASSLGKGLDMLLGLDGATQGMRLVRMLSI